MEVDDGGNDSRAQGATADPDAFRVVHGTSGPDSAPVGCLRLRLAALLSTVGGTGRNKDDWKAFLVFAAVVVVSLCQRNGQRKKDRANTTASAVD